MAIETVVIPDVGGDAVELIELNVAVGDTINVDDTLVVLESDKASMEIPSPMAGVVTQIDRAEGDRVSEGDALLMLDTGAAAASEPEPAEVEPEVVLEAAPAPVAPAPETMPAQASEIQLTVPDIGGEAEVIEICVAVGDKIAIDDTLCILESDKASMEVPATQAGTLVSLLVKEGDKLSEAAPLAVLSVVAAPQAAAEKPALAQLAESAPVAPAVTETAAAPSPQSPSTAPVVNPDGDVYAGPLVRKLARELGVDLRNVVASGPRSRISKDDVKAYVKAAVNKPAAAAASGGSGIPSVPTVDFSQFGPVRIEKTSKIQQLTSDNMHRSWLNVPHVTQFDDIDITELEAFRKGMKAEAAASGVKLTPLPFLIKACAVALRKHQAFNASLHEDGESLVFKDYVNIGIAVDTPAGLMVPVIKDADKKGLYELAEESTRLAMAAKDRKLKPADMKGGCFTISSLGGMGGKGFTPIVNTPEVAILGVSRLSTQPVWNGAEFVPRQMLPLSLSYDHRAINGGDAGRFFTDLGNYLAEVRRLLL